MPRGKLHTSVNKRLAVKAKALVDKPFGFAGIEGEGDLVKHRHIVRPGIANVGYCL